MTSILMAALCLLQAGPYTREQVDTVVIEPGTRIEVNNVNGDITIMGWDRDYVEVKSTMKTESDSAEFKRVTVRITAGDPLRIETKYEKPDILHKGMHVSVDYVIRVPARAGKVSVSLVDGDIVMKDVGGDADVSCVNGQVDLQGIAGSVDASCVNGDVLIPGPTVIHEISTVSGDIEVGFSALREPGVDLSSVSGSIRVAVDMKLDADIDLETLSGDLKVQGLDFNDQDVSRHHVQGKLNQGGVKISASTISGSIKIVGGL